MKYTPVSTKQFRKDVKHLRKAGFNMQKLEHVITMIASGNPLSDVYRDHALKGAMQGRRECHIAPDWLLLYRKIDNELILLLINTGDHRRVLGIE